MVGRPRVKRPLKSSAACARVYPRPWAAVQGAPIAEETGFCDHVEVIEIGGDRVTVFRQGARRGPLDRAGAGEPLPISPLAPA